MLLLKNNKIINVDISEDKTNEVLAIMPLSKLQDKESKHYNSFAVKDKIYKLIIHSNHIVPEHYGKYNFQVIQSCYKDDSSLGNYYNVFDTKGQAISTLINHGFNITIDGKEFIK